MENAHDFTVRLQDLLRRERSALAEFIVALATFDRRRLWVDLGHASLFSFLHRELGLSKGAAFYRKTAAELVQKFPEVVEPLRDGRLCFTSVVELARVLTPENREEVLPRFFLLSKREAKEVSAEIRPLESPPRRDMVTGAATHAAAPAFVFASAPPDLGHDAVHPDELPRANAERAAAKTQGVTAPAAAPPQGAPSAPRPRPETVEPLSAEASRLHVTASRRFLAKLEAARAALSHSPGRRGGGAPRGRARPPPRAAREAEGPREEAPARAAAVEGGPRARPRAEGRLGAGRRPVPRGARVRRALRLHAARRGRPQGRPGPRRTADGREPSLPVQGA